MRISIIVAMARNRVIGLDGDLPWRLPDDMRFFMNTTMGKPVIMGRHTFVSLGKPLPGRLNIVVSTQLKTYAADNVEIVTDLAAGLDLARTQGAQEAFIGGGAALYREALPMADRIYLTEVDAAPDGDTHFPALNSDQWREISRRHHAADARHPHSFDFVLLEAHRENNNPEDGR